MSLAEIESLFPNLKDAGYEKSSDYSEDYNCFAFAARETTCRLDPAGYADCDWPDNILPTRFLASFLELYRGYGFEVCANGDLEDGYEKIAIYTNDEGKATHAARQLESGKWVSKIGDLEDIEHNTLQSLEGFYGKLAKFMKRPIPPKPGNPTDAKN